MPRRLFKLVVSETAIVFVLIFKPIPAVDARITVNENAWCTGDLVALNSGGYSPCTLYRWLQAPCRPGGTGFDSSVCACNAAAYNLGNACLVCGNSSAQPWRTWAEDFDCRLSMPPSQLLYTPPSEELFPKWAFQNYTTSDAMFDVNAIIRSTHTGWTPIQIALPIITAVGTLIIVLAVLYIYHLRNRPAQMRVSHWAESPHVRGPRRFFGMFPEVLRVRKETKDTLWEIDTLRQPRVSSGARRTRGTPGSSTLATQVSSSPPSSPTTAYSPITPMDGVYGPSEQPGFSNFISRFRWISHGREGSIDNEGGVFFGRGKFTKGVAKADSYKRINVTPDIPDEHFKIEDSDIATPVSGTSRGRMPSLMARLFPSRIARVTNPDRSGSIPSVIDISQDAARLLEGHDDQLVSDFATLGEGEPRPGRTRDTMRAVAMGVPILDRVPRPPSIANRLRFDRLAEHDTNSLEYPRPPRSDFTLGTVDLVTPNTEATYAHAQFVERNRGDAQWTLKLPSPTSVRADSTVLPAPSPLEPSKPSTSR